MNVVVQIADGEKVREAIPVRAIQFVLGWKQRHGAFTVVRELARIGTDDFPLDRPVLAQELDEQGRIKEVLPLYWKGLAARLSLDNREASP